jgi:hypothetical protein
VVADVSDVSVLVKEPIPDPSTVFVDKDIVGVVDVLQTIPLEVTG